MSFQSIVASMAVVLLILGLVYIGKIIHESIMNRDYPPIISRCPDYFKLTKQSDGREVCENVNGLGDGVATYPENGSAPTVAELRALAKKRNDDPIPTGLRDIHNFLQNHELSWDGFNP